MKLKSMELIGFKSFAQDTKITFPSGLTEIVGPNGSGKSNVIEAIRWALGEQSVKRLRSSKMTDVIFSGSKGHPALNRAKVVLVFDNHNHWIKSDYSKLKVARKIYRNGDSYYYLNGRECRLRDVQNLFMNSGIGTGSFSIISQGQVEQIFKSKPEDRRFIVETAAGIYRYKAQKRVAQQKIKATNNNITRVTDLVNEYQHQLKRLSNQRNQAQKYLSKQRLYNKLDNQRLILKWHNFEQQIVKFHRQIDYYHKILARFDYLITHLQQRQRNSRQLVKTLQYRDEQLQQRLLEVIQQANDYNNHRKLALQKLIFHKQSCQYIYTRLTHLHKLSHQLMFHIKNREPKIECLHRRIKQLKLVVKKLVDSSLQNQVHLKRQRIERLRTQYIEELQKSAHIDNQIHDFQKNRRTLVVRSQEKQQRLDHFNQLIRQSRLKGRRLSQSIDQIKQRLKDTTIQIKYLTNQINRRRLELHRDSESYDCKMQWFKSIRVQRDGLTRLMASHSTLHRGTRNLLKVADQNQGILGPVANFIKVPSRYVKAVETTLKSQLQQIIVTTPQVARKAINFLNAKRLGRVTFLPLRDVTKRWINQKLIQQSRILPGLIGTASELVTMPLSMERIKSHLLGNVLIAKDLHSAVQISFNLHHRYRVVTLNGEVVNAGGAITGGRGHYKYHGILSQRNESQQLDNELRTSQDNLIQQHSRLVQKRQQFHRFKKQLLQFQNRISQGHQELISKIRMQNHVIKGIKQQRREQQTIKLSFNHLINYPSGLNLSELTHNKQRVKKILQKNELIVKHLKSEVSKYQQQINKKRQKYQDQRVELIRDQNKLSILEHQSRMDHRSIDKNQELDRQLLSKKKDTELLIQQLQKNLKTDRSRVNQLRIHQMKVKRQRCQSQLVGNRTNLKKMTQEIYHYQNVLMRNKARYSRLKFQSHQIIHQLNLIADQFHKRHISIRKCSLPQYSLASLSFKLKRVRQAIRRIGIVNLKSIREFSRVHHHYSFVHQQLIDLVQSQRQLSTAMEGMNTTIKARFKKTFDKINRAFYGTYTEIFKGGHAKLELTDPKHLLTTGINIMAQPPGKRYRSMELLSGGERALTAIALLFAVIKIKPVPFCILDEAESALDLVNVSRFAQYISKLKRRTQFIVITHRKETMLYADNLYGITMQQSGISTVISVNLDRIKKER